MTCKAGPALEMEIHRRVYVPAWCSRNAPSVRTVLTLKRMNNTDRWSRAGVVDEHLSPWIDISSEVPRAAFPEFTMPLSTFRGIWSRKNSATRIAELTGPRTGPSSLDRELSNWHSHTFRQAPAYSNNHFCRNNLHVKMNNKFFMMLQ